MINRRDLLKTGSAATAAALLMPGGVAAQGALFAPKPGAWRDFEVVTRLDLAAGGKAQAWIPLPSVHEEEWIRPGDNRWQSNAASVEVVRDPKYGAQMLHAVFKEGETAPSVEVTSRFSLRDRAEDFGARSETKALSAAERTLYLEATELMPTDGIVKETADKAAAGKTDDIEKARAIYQWVVDNTFRNAKTRGCGTGDVASMLRTGNLGGKCADLNALFVALARAAGIPARDIYGIRVAPSKFGFASLGAGSATVTKAQHCRAEVWLEGLGWVATDPADVRKVVLEEPPGNNAPDAPKVVAAREALFGAWEGNWLGYNVAHDLELPGSRHKVSFLMYPQAEVAGALLDCLDPDTFRYAIRSAELGLTQASRVGAMRARRSDLEPSMRPIYLDYNATTPIAPEVLEAMMPYLTRAFGNPSSHHALGHEARDAMERARAEVALLIGAEADEIVFTGGGTEASNLAIRGTLQPGNGDRVVTTAIEHPATEECCLRLEAAGHAVLRVAPEADGIVAVARMAKAIGDRAALVTVIHAQNEIGTLQPVAEITAIARRAGALVHADAAQSVGKVAVDVGELGVDLMSVAGHKLNAPKGVGALFVRRGVKVRPVLVGGGQERGIRPGTQNVAFIVGLGAACALARQRVTQEQARLRRLAERLLRGLEETVPGLALVGDRERRLPNTLNVLFPGVSARHLLESCPDVIASVGSACHADSEEPSAVLTALGIPREAALGAVRLSLGRDSSADDVDAAVPALAGAWRALASARQPAPALSET